MTGKILLGACLLLAGAGAHAIEARRIADPQSIIGLDGRLDEAAWRDAPLFDNFIQNQPADRVPAHVRTEVRMLYDARYLYVGVRALQASAALRAPFARRDKVGNDQDYIALFLDPAGSNKAAQVIYVNPRGAVSDGSYSDTNGADLSPDIEFDVATAHDEQGWSAEVRIPWASLAYDSKQAPNWRLLVMRNMTRDTRYVMYSGAVPRGSNCLLCYSEAIDGLRDLPTALNWSATPQVAARRARDRIDGQPARTSSGAEAGLDVKLRPDSATVIDLTLNPDFSQIELDAPQLSGNTRFGLFVQEKRPFFLEGSDIFQTPFRAISTRSITAPSWGLRYTRRDAGSDVTVLSSHDTGGGLVLLPGPYGTGMAAQNFSSQASNLRANLRFGALGVGAVVSDRSLEGGRGYNRVAGPDFVWQRSATERMRGQLLLSSTSAQPDRDGNLVAGAHSTGHAALLSWFREQGPWGLFLVGTDISEGFRADNGFFSQAGFREYMAELQNKRGGAGPFDAVNLSFFVKRQSDRQGQLIMDEYAPGLSLAGPYDSQIDVQFKPRNHVRVRQGGELFALRQLAAQIGASPGRMLARVSAELTVGDQVDVEAERLGRGALVLLSAQLRPSDRVELNAVYSATWVNGKSGIEQGRRLYTEQAPQLSGIYHLGPADTLRLILQYSRIRRDPLLTPASLAPASSARTSSLVYGHAGAFGSAAFVGLTLSDGVTPGYFPQRRQDELFIKYSWRL